MRSPLPKAIDEQDFCVPSQRGLAANTCRRNFTDAQETAQWLGGVEVPTRLLESLLTQGQKLNNKAVVVSTTSYDGQLELACWKMGIPCMSFTDSGTNQKYAAGVVGDALLQEIAHSCVQCLHINFHSCRTGKTGPESWGNNFRGTFQILLKQTDRSPP